MHRLFIVLLFAFHFSNAQAQICNDCFTFQGVARDQAGHIAANKSISLRLGIQPFFQSIAYSETHHISTNAQGIFNVLVGNGSVNQGDFKNIAWENNSYFLQVEIDIAGGENYINLGATQLVSVPFALHSRQAQRWTNFEPVIQIGSITSGSILNTVGDGARLVWYPKKSAFMSGYSEGNSWRDENIGLGSTAFGLSPLAKGSYSSAHGVFSVASGEASFSAGLSSEARGAGSAAFGNAAIGQGAYSFASGDHTVSEGNSSFAAGLSSQAKGLQSAAIGNGPIAFGNSSAAIGYKTAANGDASFAAGAVTNAKAFGAVALGAYNNVQDNPGGGTYAQLNQSDRIFQVGNGTGETSLSNALTILRNGNVGLGNGALIPQYILDISGRPRIRHNVETAGLYFDNSDHKPEGFVGMKTDNQIGFYLANDWRFWVNGTGGATLIGSLTQISDKRLKRDFSPLSGSLQNILQLNGYHYYWKDAKLTQAKQTGFIAQEIEKVFPELVKTGADSFKTVDYISLIPHLVEAIKELKSENEQLKQQMHRIDQLEAALKSQMEKVSQMGK